MTDRPRQRGPDLPVPAVNLEILRKIALDIGDNSPQALIEAYLGQSDGWITELAAAAGAGHSARVAQIALTLGSSSALLGAEPLTELLADIVSSTSKNASDEMLLVMSEVIAAEYERVATALRAECDLPPTRNRL